MKRCICLILFTYILSACSTQKTELHIDSRQIASNQNCQDLIKTILDNPKVKDTSINFPEKLIEISESFRKQLKDGVRLRSIKIKVDFSLHENLVWMESQLSLMLKQKKIVFGSYEREQKIKDFEENLKNLKTLDELDYLDYLWNAQKFTQVMSMQEHLLAKNSLDRPVAFTQFDKFFDDHTPEWFEKMVESLTEGQVWFLFPTFKNLDIKDMNVAFSEGIGYLGLTTDKIYVDRQWMLPHRFFAHDMDHTSAFEKIGPNEILSINERRKIFMKFNLWLDQNHFSDSDKELYHVIWFITLHEYNQRLNYESLKIYFKKQVSDPHLRQVKFDVEAINDPKLYERSFNSSKITKDDLVNSYRKLISFIDANNKE